MSRARLIIQIHAIQKGSKTLTTRGVHECVSMLSLAYLSTGFRCQTYCYLAFAANLPTIINRPNTTCAFVWSILHSPRPYPAYLLFFTSPQKERGRERDQSRR